MLKIPPEMYFCTYADENYIPNAIALLESLRSHAGAFHLQLLCLTPEAHRVATPYEAEDFSITSLEALESKDPELLNVKKQRSQIEYYFTLTPCWTLVALQRLASAEWMTYLDADTYFFDSPASVFKQIRNASIGITPHRFKSILKHSEVYGKFNVGWVSFRKDKNGIACLVNWREKCLEWCYDYVAQEKYADQKYLDTWPLEYPGTEVISDNAVNLALWSADSRDLSFINSRACIHRKPIIHYHFSGLTQITDRIFDPRWELYKVKPCRTLIYIYKKYLKHLKKIRENRDFVQHSKSVRNLVQSDQSLSFQWKHIFGCIQGKYIYV